MSKLKKYASAFLLTMVFVCTGMSFVYADTLKEDMYGTWTDPDSGRLRMQIIPGSYKSAVDGGQEHDLFIRVYWSSSATEGTEYLLSADKAEDGDVYTYENGMISNCLYSEDGDVQKEVLTTGSSGNLTISSGEEGAAVLEWEDFYGDPSVSVQLEQLTMGVPGSEKPIRGEIDYSDKDYWVSFPYNDATEDTYDVFLVEPTVNMKDRSIANENILKAKTIQRFRLTFNMEKGILGDRARIYCPLYRQKTMGCYMDDPDSENGTVQMLGNADRALEESEISYEDVKSAFLYYLENVNNGRPFVLFGYSQGAEMLLRVLEEMGDNEQVWDQLVAAYLVGWKVTEEDLSLYPHLKMAQGADDTGVIVCFDCIDERAENPDYHTFSINPLNWKIDDTPASAGENLGYAGTDTDGVVNLEIPQYCGAYIDPETGILRITDMDESLDLYEQESGLFPKGYYHLYDLNLFYRNIQQNIADRVDAKKLQQANDEKYINYFVLVNKTHPLPDGWEAALKTVHFTNSVGDDVEVEQKAYEAYLGLKEDLEAEGVYVDLDSARRSVAAQQAIMDEFTERYGADYAAKTVAKPGYSEHHTGLALDLYLIIDGEDIVENEDMIEYPDIWAKIHEKLADYGFILRYLEGKEHITGYAYEPWHIRYLDDKEAAQEIMSQPGMTLEVWLGEASDPELDIDYGNSELYTKDELEEAMIQVKCQFAFFDGCELHSIRYAGDESNSEQNLAWLNELDDGAGYVQAAEILTDFHSPAQSEGAWNLDEEYTDFQWWLARTEDSGWQLVSWGY